MTKSRTGLSGATLLVVAITSLAGCATGSTHRVVVPHRPPPPKAVERPPRPSHKHVWVSGHWRWRDGDWAWVKGHYVVRPHPRARWVPGRWQHRRSGWIWIEGHWRRP